MRTIGIALTAIALLTTIGANNQVSPSPLAAESAEADGLALSMRANSPGSSGALRLDVTLENTGQKDILLNLGTMLGNGRIQRHEAIRLLVVDWTGDRRVLHYADPDVPGVAGRIDDYAVPLRAGSTHSVALEIRDFWCPATKEHAIVLPPGAYEVRAQFEGAGAQHDGGMPSPPYWTGTLESGAVLIKIGENGQAPDRR
jgi:hypothetical protein